MDNKFSVEEAQRIVSAHPDWEDFIKGIDIPDSYREFARAKYFLEGVLSDQVFKRPVIEEMIQTLSYGLQVRECASPVCAEGKDDAFCLHHRMKTALESVMILTVKSFGPGWFIVKDEL